jgi:uncharacterized protein
MFMNKDFIIGGALTCGLALGGVAFASSINAHEAPLSTKEASTMTVMGTATVTAAPDQASLSLGIRNIEADASAAMQANSLQMTEVFAVLAKAGVDASDISTSGLSLQPQYGRHDGQSQKIEGYQAMNNLTVTIDKIDSAGAVLDAVVGAGINSISNLRFEKADTTSLEAEARAAAIRDARAKAEAYADALGTTVIGVKMVNEAGISRPQPMYDSMSTMRASAPVPIAQDDVSVTATVSAVFEIESTLK